jgi:hypothetical protein
MFQASVFSWGGLTPLALREVFTTAEKRAMVSSTMAKVGEEVFVNFQGSIRSISAGVA